MNKTLSILFFLFASLAGSAQDDLYKPAPKTEAISVKNLNEVKVFTHKNSDGTTEQIEIPFIDGDVVFEKVLELENNTAADILKKAKLVMVDFARSAKDMTQLVDEDNKILIAKGWTRSNPYSPFRLLFTLKIECRDNRYKITIYNIQSTNTPTTTLEITITPEFALKHTVRKDGVLKSGLNTWEQSFWVWYNFARETFDLFNDKMPKVSLNNGEDW